MEGFFPLQALICHRNVACAIGSLQMNAIGPKSIPMTIFEKIIARQIPAKIAYEDGQAIVIHDLNPQAPVHLLIIPRKAIPTLNDLSDSDEALVGHLFVVAKKVMADLGHADYRTVFNCGAGAQQSVFHLHLHVLAGRNFTWPPG